MRPSAIRWLRTAFTLAAGMFLIAAGGGGCATILGGGDRQSVLVQSTPPGAHVEVVDHKGKVVHNGVTPFTVTLRRGAGYFAAERYTARVVADPGAVHAGARFGPTAGGAAATAARQAELRATLNPWYVGNIVFGGLVGGLLVDPATGAMWQFPREVNVDTPPAVKSPPKSKTAAAPGNPRVDGQPTVAAAGG